MKISQTSRNRRERRTIEKPSTNQVKDVWDIAPVGLAILDRKGNILQTNRNFRLFSTRDLNPYFRPTLKRLLRKAEKTGRNIVKMELTGRRGLYSTRPDQWSISLFRRRHPRGTPGNAILMVENISERKQLQHKVRQVFETLPNIIVVSEKSRKIIRVSSRAEQLFGYAEAELLGKRIEAVIPQQKQRSYLQRGSTRLSQPLKPLAETSYITVGVHKDGYDIPIEVWVNSVQTSDGLQIVASIIDLSSLRKAEMQIKEGQERFRVMADAMPIIVFLTGAERGCTYVNKEGLGFFGLPLEKMLEFGWAEVVHPEDRQKCLDEHREIFESRKTGTVEFRARRLDGEYRWLLTAVRPMIDTNQKFIGYIMTSIDNTDTKSEQINTHKSQMDLMHARRVSAVGELASSLAHELNQPLSAILSNAQAALRYLRAKPIDLQNVGEILNDIVADDKRAGMIIRRLRSLVKKQEMEIIALNINDLVEEVVALLHGKSLECETRIQVNLSPNLPAVRGDSIQLQQVLLNIMVNGFEAMSETPIDSRLLVVETRQTGIAEVEIMITDAGAGIPENRLEQMFHPFFTTKKEGLGMGLSIARTIIEAHKGSLWVENCLPGGAKFHIALPTSDA